MMKILFLLLLGVAALAQEQEQEVQWVTVSSNKNTNTRPSRGYEPARIMEVAEDKSVSETHFYASSTLTAEQDNKDAIAAQEAAEEASNPALLETSVKGPRKFVLYFKQGNTGEVLATYKNLNPRRCLRLCERNSQCVGFTVKRNGRGSCTLRKNWGGPVVTRSHDSYLAIDYSTALIDSMRTNIRISEAGQQLLVIGSIQQTRLPRPNKAIELELSVDDDHAMAGVTYLNWARKDVRAVASANFHMVSLPLAKGAHTVTMTRKRDDSDGPIITQCTPRFLVAFPFPRSEGPRHWEIAGQVWNLGITRAITNRAFQPLPGQAMTIKFPTLSGQRVLMMADISRVQHGSPEVNSVFQLVLDGQSQGITNTGNSYSWDYKQIALRSLSEPLSMGEHTLSVEALTNAGTLHLINDQNGHQQRRLTALIVPGDLAWQKTWNPGQAHGNSKTWAPLPGPAMSMENIDVKAPTWVLVFGSISRVQTWASANVELRLVVNDNKVLAQHTTSDVQGWRYSDVLLQGYYFLQPGKYKFSVEYKTSGATVVFANDVNGYQQRRLIVVGLGVPADDVNFAHKGEFCDMSLNKN